MDCFVKGVFETIAAARNRIILSFACVMAGLSKILLWFLRKIKG